MANETRVAIAIVGTLVCLAFLLVAISGVVHPPVSDDVQLQDPFDVPPPTFAEVASERGFEYEYVEGEYHGMISMTTDAGVYASDVNQNGLTDLLAVGGEDPVLFENVGGEFERSDRLPHIDGTINGALFFDFDNDGSDDLLLLRSNDTALFLENRDGEFEVKDVGLDREFTNPIGAAVADYTGDGCLDLYIAQNGNWDDARPQGTLEQSVGDDDNGLQNYLYRGDCNGFEEVNGAGIEGERWTLATTFVDLTGNGLPDIYDANDFNYDLFYENQGDGTFERKEMPDSSDRNAMSATVMDFTGDQQLDIFITNIFYDDRVEEVMPGLPVRTEGNNLFVRTADGWFEDRAVQYRVHEGGWGWAAAAADYNNNQYTDIFHTNSPLGAERTLRERYRMADREIDEQYPYIRYPMYFQRTSADRFTRLHPPEQGFLPGSGRGTVPIDLHNDGNLDIAVADTHNPFRLYENQGVEGNWLRIDVKGDGDHTTIGAEVTVTTGDQTQYQVKHSQADFLSQQPRSLHFGLGEQESANVTVTWPSGEHTEFTVEEVNQGLRVYPDGTIESGKIAE